VLHAEGLGQATGMLIVISGPVASGKSTVARELARDLEQVGVRAAVIDLDLLHDMLIADGSMSDDSTWTLARRAMATLANTFLEEGVAVVIADGSFNRPSDRAILAQHLRTDAHPIYVTLRVSFEEALRRAQADPTRGRSQDPLVLAPYFAAVSRVLETIPATDVVIDTERTTPASAAARIGGLIRPASI
jgi:adenylylsulfate kinase-like enzyme